MPRTLSFQGGLSRIFSISLNSQNKYRKLPIISPGLIFVLKAALLGLFSGELIFGGDYYWKEFCVSKWVGLDNKNSLKHYENSLKQLKTAGTNSPPWAYFREGLIIIGRIFACEILGGLFSERLNDAYCPTNVQA